MKKLILLLLVPTLAVLLYATTAGPNSQGDTTGSGFTSPGNAAVLDGTASSGGPDGEILEVGTFGFAIPSGATIDGVLVEMEGRCFGCEGGENNDVNLTGVGTCTSKPYDEGGSPALPTVAHDSTYESFGGAADTWSCTSLTQANVNATAFGVTLTTSTGVDNNETRIDHVRVTVYYTAAGGDNKYKSVVIGD